MGAKRLEVKKLRDDFRFETLVDAQSSAFREYLSTVFVRLANEDEVYRAIRDKIENIYERYPRVMDIFDSEQATALSEQECAALVEVLELRNQLEELEQESVYLRGCYDGVGYLKKAGIL